MNEISLLIFSRNDLDRAWGLIDDMKEVTDEIVLLDGSDSKLHEQLLKKAKEKGSSNLKIFRVPALGYPDPLRMYGLSKCKNEWVFLVDTDERLCTAFKADIHKIISRRADAFAIKRYEYAIEEGMERFYTWQIRLFKKSKVLFKGLVHEQAAVSGHLETLEDAYFMEHRRELHRSSPPEYMELDIFARLDYASYNGKMLDYLSKFLVLEDRAVKNTRSGRTLIALMNGYERLLSKKPEQELSGFDYYVFNLAKNLGYSLTSRKIGRILGVPSDAYRDTKATMSMRKRPNSDTEFQISHLIQSKGVTRFLELDKEKTITHLNKTYGDKQQGSGLLIKLIRERYEKIRSKDK